MLYKTYFAGEFDTANLTHSELFEQVKYSTAPLEMYYSSYFYLHGVLLRTLKHFY